MPVTVLLVEDEPGIADTLMYALQSEGFAPRWHSTGRAALDDHRVSPAEFVILDVGLPDINGFDLCRSLRSISNVPILFLTARSGEIDRIVGLEIGADDYVTKPFSPREVCARVRTILRRTSTFPPVAAVSLPDPPTREDTRGLSHDGERCEVRWDRKKLDLTRYEYRLLVLLMGRPGRVFSRDDVMAQVWEDPGVSLDRTVDAHIKTLRAKLRAVGGDYAADLIQTHRGMGYSLRES